MLNIITHPVVLLTVGGAVGTNARYWLSVLIHHQGWTKDFPLATLLVNVSGSLVLGLCVVLFHTRWPTMWILLGVGFCGGYTTFSTFAWETLVLIHEKQQTGLAVANIVLSVGLSCAAVWFAVTGMKATLPPTPTVHPVMEAADPEARKEP